MKTSNPPRPPGHLAGWEVLCGLAIGVGVIWYMASDSTPSARPTPEPDPYMAFIQCQAFVKNRLKAPATAQFPSQPLSAIDTGANTYIVTATVDAQNGFGALLRNNWLCKTQYTGGHPADPSSWALQSLSMQ